MQWLHIVKVMMRNWMRRLLPNSTFLSIMIFSNFCNTVKGSTYVKGTRNTKIESLSQQACGVLDKMINGSTSVQQADNSFEFGYHFGGPNLLTTLLYSFPMSVATNFTHWPRCSGYTGFEKRTIPQGILYWIFSTSYKKNVLNDFTTILLVELWFCNNVRESLEISINNSKFNYKMTCGIYEYKSQNNYSYDIVFTVHLYISKLKFLEASKYSHTFEDIFDENGRDYDLWMDLLRKHQQCSDSKVVISLYAGTN